MKFSMSYLILLYTFLSPSSFALENFTGKWYGEVFYDNKKIPESTFELQLIQNLQKVSGRYCFITKYGNRIDCVNDDEINIKGVAQSKYISLVTFNSSFGGKDGKAKLTIEGDHLKWTVLTLPMHGKYYIPKEYLLTRKAAEAHSHNTLETKDYIVTVTNNCEVVSKPCNNVSYLGIRKSDNNVINLSGTSFYSVNYSGVVSGYEFSNKEFSYRVYLDEAKIEVIKDNKIIFSQKGVWKDK